MSAFQVSDDHISAILQGVYGKNYEGVNIWKYQTDPEAYHFKSGLADSCQAEANELMAENVRSVEYRYPEHEKTSMKFKVKLNFKAEPRSPLAVLKLIECLEYQSCETPDFQQSEAYKLICKYKQVMICKLPGWNEEKWSI